jgi:uncharacterized pyridoxal phosphate-dependent enzyme
MSDRRAFLQRFASLPVLGGLVPALAAPRRPAGRDYFAELGVRTFINAAGTFTAMSASLMPLEVTEAWQAASRHYVNIAELQDKVGARIASLVGAESAMVTSGAAGALTCGTAGCIAGTDQNAIHQLPDVTGLKSEVIIQKAHRFGYEHAMRAAGAKFVEVETAEDVERAVNSQTAMMFFLNFADPAGKIKAAEWVALGKKHGIPTFTDCAADVPPASNLSKYVKMGFDLVTFSGGKGLRGPQSAGLLLGTKERIAAARANTSPNGDTLSRGMKVNKEEILGMLVAVETYLKKDHEAEWKDWERRVQTIVASVRDLPSLQTEMFVPEIANQVPHLKIWWDEAKLKLAPPEVQKRMREGQPSIEVSPMTSPKQLVVGVWMLEPGEAEIVGRRIREVLKSA